MLQFVKKLAQNSNTFKIVDKKFTSPAPNLHVPFQENMYNKLFLSKSEPGSLSLWEVSWLWVILWLLVEARVGGSKIFSGE